MDSKKLEQGIQYLAEQGLNLYAVFDCATLPDDLIEIMTDDQVPLSDYSRLVLLGNAGAAFWPVFQAYGLQTDHPVDHFCLNITQQFLDTYLAAATNLMLYPQAFTIPLQRLGTLAGWSHPSPLGLGIHPTYGVWFAYRAAFLTTASLPVTKTSPSPSPCDSCQNKPCISACPAGAVQGVGAFDIPACADFRLSTNSVCADRCLSRLACPHAPEYQYPEVQIQYHYNFSLSSIRLYLKENRLNRL